MAPLRVGDVFRLTDIDESFKKELVGRQYVSSGVKNQPEYLDFFLHIYTERTHRDMVGFLSYTVCLINVTTSITPRRPKTVTPLHRVRLHNHNSYLWYACI